MAPGSPSSLRDSKESRLCFLENESLMDCSSLGDAQSSLACELMPIFPYPEDHKINSSSQSQETDHVMLYPYRNITSYKNHLPKACHSQDTEKPISQNFVHTVAQTGELWCQDIELSIVENNRSRNLPYPVQFDGSCIPPASEDAGYDSYIPSNNLIPCSPVKYASLSSAYPHELPVDLRVLSPGNDELGSFLGYEHGIGTSLNFEFQPWNATLNPEVSSHNDSHVAKEKVIGVDGIGESMHVTGNSEKCPQNPTEFSHASGAAVPNKKHHRLSSTGSKQDNVRRAVNGHNSFGLQHENSKVSRSFQTESAAQTAPPAVPGKRSNKVRIQSGKPSLGPQYIPAQNKLHSADAVVGSRNQTAKAIKYTAEAIKKTGNKLSSAPQQIWQVKGKGEPSQVSSKSLLKVWQVKKSRVPSKNSSISKVNRSKKKTEASNDSATLLWRVKEKSASRRKRNTRKLQIKWDGDDENDKPVGHNCCLCENDLAFPPTKPDIELEFHNFADVAILPCGHTFHMECLEVAMSEEQLKDPSCFICLSEA